MKINFKYILIILFLLICMVMPQEIIFAQAPIINICLDTIKNRVNQLERISNTHSQLLNQLYQQIYSNQNDIDILRGRIQENQYQLNQIVERQKQIMLQIDRQNGEGKKIRSFQ